MRDYKFLWFIFLVVIMVLSFAMLHYDEMTRTIMFQKAINVAKYGSPEGK